MVGVSEGKDRKNGKEEEEEEDRRRFVWVLTPIGIISRKDLTSDRLQSVFPSSSSSSSSSSFSFDANLYSSFHSEEEEEVFEDPYSSSGQRMYGSQEETLLFA